MQNNKKPLIKALCSLLLIFPVFSSEAQVFHGRELHFSLEPVISFEQGKLGEIIYSSEIYDSSKKRSYLEWDRDILLLGANFGIDFKKFHFNLYSASTLFNKNFGQMTDSDWLNSEDLLMKTTYSAGDISNSKNYEFSSTFAYSFETTRWLEFSPVIQFQYNYDFFEREDSEGWYSSDNRHWWYDETSIHYPHTYWNGEKYVHSTLGEIDLCRHSFYTWFGLNAKIKPFSRLNLDFTTLLSPFAYFYSVDTHLAMKTGTNELYEKHFRMIQFSDFNTLLMSAKASFMVNDFLELTLKGSCYFTFEPERGTCYIDFTTSGPQNTYYDTEQDSGASLQIFSIQAGCKVKIQ